MKQPADHRFRAETLDVTRSFIVKAPAGSGKTTLLVKRYLKLLSTVNAPEEVSAITFTRKAASEMIERVLTAMKLASRDDKQNPDPELIESARLALMQNDTKQWQLLSNPSRIRIQTIDALSQQLVRQMPWSAGFGAAPSTVDDNVNQYYLLAARQALLSALGGKEYRSAAESLLLALDNNFARLADLLVGMLARRDQWQQFLVSELNADAARQRLETSWEILIEQALVNCDKKLDFQLRQELLLCAHYAAENLTRLNPDSGIVELKNIDVFPAPQISVLKTWQTLSGLLLTATGSLRKRIDKNAGFPSKADGGDESIKTLFKSVLEKLADAGLEPEFKQIQCFPEARFSDEEWSLLTALTQILKLAVAELTVVFQHQGVCDHIEIATRANLALGETESPSDLALRLDYKIQHLLVDEFQDTSHTQIELLKRLTAGWQVDDGRTLFFVGDPMQSIYRFREADVSIFLDIFKHGFNSLPLKSITLSENFRSGKPLVEWVNQHFANIFPRQDDQQLAAIKYSPSKAHKTEQQEDQQVSIHVVDKTGEANAVLRLIQQISIDSDHEQDIAVLVRSRKHLDEIVALLNETGVNYQGVKLQKLSHLSCIQDIFALTKALCHLGDRLSWLAILRAPWCGLDLVTLTVITSYAENKTIWQALEAISDEFDPKVQSRIDRFKNIMRPVVSNVGKSSLHDNVRQVWQALGGADTITAVDQTHILTYLQLLNKIESAGQIEKLDQFEKNLDDLWASTDNSQARLQLMTIHTAKGLEFDTVILPGLYKKPRVESTKLLIWNEFVLDNEASLLLSPIKINDRDNRRYEFVRSLEKNIQREENKRLLYVVCTRAIRQLHLFVSPKPDSASLQALMQNQIRDNIDATSPSLIEDQTDVDQAIVYKRLPDPYVAPKLPEKRVNKTAFDDAVQIVEYQWAGVTAIHLGTLIHEIICKFAEHGESTITGKTQQWRRRLLALGVGHDQLDPCLQRINQVLDNIKTDKCARWILSTKHQDRHNEWPLTSHTGAKLENSIIDRTFIDDQDVRWIIDYKTSTHEGGNIEAFLESEQQRYSNQLENYAAIMRLRENNPIKLGLYFPLLTAWCAWPYVD